MELRAKARQLKSENNIDLLIPHQASHLAIKAYSKYGGFNEDG